MEPSASTPAGSTKRSRASRTSSQPSIQPWASTGRRRFATHRRVVHTRMWTHWVRTDTFRPTYCPASMASRVFCALLLCTLLAVSAEPGMVLIPGGDFLRGRTYEWEDYDMPWSPNPAKDDRPVRKISLDPFYLDESEVTNERYAAFLKATQKAPPYYWRNGQIPEGKEKHPVVNVDW